MDFDLTEEQQAVRDLAADLFAGRVDHERLAALEARDAWFDRDLWAEVASTGLTGIALAEDVGGAGLTLLELHLALEQAAAASAYVPLYETVVLGALPIDRFGTAEQRRRWLPGVVDGSTLLTAALHEDGPTDPRDPQTSAVRDGDGWVLHGTKSLVPTLDLAAAVLVVAATGEGLTTFLVPTGHEGVTTSPQRIVDRTPHATLTLDGVRLSSEAVLGAPGEGGPVLDWLLPRATVGLTSLMSGTCQAVLRLASTYTSQREQFERPVATFQAVGHRVADAFIDTEAVRLTSLQAAWRLAEDLPAAEEVAIAAWWAADAGHRVIHASHHVHGGVGVDHDYPLHRFFGTAKRIEFALGGAVTPLLDLGATLAAEPA